MRITSCQAVCSLQPKKRHKIYSNRNKQDIAKYEHFFGAFTKDVPIQRVLQHTQLREGAVVATGARRLTPSRVMNMKAAEIILLNMINRFRPLSSATNHPQAESAG